jgi:hypothetical protein
MAVAAFIHYGDYQVTSLAQYQFLPLAGDQGIHYSYTCLM